MNLPQSYLSSIRFYLLLSASALLLFSCSSTRHLAQGNSAQSNTGPKFLNGIRVNPGDRVSSRDKSYGYLDKAPENSAEKDEGANPSLNTRTLVQKYASIMGVSAGDLKDIDLFEDIDNWYGTPYSYGGNSKNGIDCSAFSRTLLSDVYNLSLPRTAQEQYDYCKHIKKSQLKEGDLVFFHTTGGARITHVGIYLQNGKFVHASTSSGVMISDLDDYYWRRTYRAAGRIADKDVTLN